MSSQRCCCCNGCSVRSVQCSCVKNGFPCSNCFPLSNGWCQNITANSSSQPHQSQVSSNISAISPSAPGLDLFYPSSAPPASNSVSSLLVILNPSSLLTPALSTISTAPDQSAPLPLLHCLLQQPPLRLLRRVRTATWTRVELRLCMSALNSVSMNPSQTLIEANPHPDVGWSEFNPGWRKCAGFLVTWVIVYVRVHAPVRA